MSTPVLEFEDVSFSYGPTPALRDVNMTLCEHDYMAIVGPNGGGKSTLLKLALGVLKPDEGTIRVFGRRPGGVMPRVGYVPQHLNFDTRYPITVDHVVLMGLLDQHGVGVYRRGLKKRAGEMLARVGLGHAAGRLFRELSGGERQRVLLARALIGDPELLLLDEPTANMDRVHEARMYEMLADLCNGLTICVVSHNVNIVTRHASMLACVNRSCSMHPLEDVSDGHIHEIVGSAFLRIHHDSECDVFEPHQHHHHVHARGNGGGS